jgi:WD40-like Beta Propeller Repeat
MRVWFACLLTVAVGVVPAAVRAAPAGENGALVFTCGEGASRAGSQVYPEGICVTDPDGGNSRRLDGDPVAFANSPGGDSEPVWSPDGRQIAWVRSVGTGGVREVFVMNADGTEPRQLTSLGGFARSPSWSPDGAKIAFALHNGISLVDVEGGAIHQLTGVAPLASDPAWSPDGTRIAYVAHAGFACTSGSDACPGRNALRSIASDGTDERVVSDVSTIDFRAPSWSPDGANIAAGCSNMLCIVSAAGGEPRRLDIAGTAPSWSPDGRRIAFSRITMRPTVSGPHSEVHVCMVDPDGANPRRIATGVDPNWQPLASGGLTESASAAPCPRTPLSRSPELRSVEWGKGRLTARFGSLAGVDAATVFISTAPYRFVHPGGWMTSGRELRDSLSANEIAAASWTNELDLSPGTYYVRVETRDYDCDPCIQGYSDTLSVRVTESTREEPDFDESKTKQEESVPRAQVFRGRVKIARRRAALSLTLSVRPFRKPLAYVVCWRAKKGRACARGRIADASGDTGTHTLRVSMRRMRRSARFTWYVNKRPVASRVRSLSSASP